MSNPPRLHQGHRCCHRGARRRPRRGSTTDLSGTSGPERARQAPSTGLRAVGGSSGGVCRCCRGRRGTGDSDDENGPWWSVVHQGPWRLCSASLVPITSVEVASALLGGVSALSEESDSRCYSA